MTQPSDPEPIDPDDLTRAVPSADSPAEPLAPTPSGSDPVPQATEPEPPPGPIVSWAPSGSDPSGSGVAAVDDPVGGDVIATTWARFVAYSIDGLLVNVVPLILSLLVVDWEASFRAGLELAQNPGAPIPVADMGLEGTMLTLIGVAIGFVYFVGLWTSDSRATLGMRGLRMRIVDANSGGSLTLTAAAKRWVALGGPVPLLGLISPLAAIAGLASAGLALVLLISTASDSRRQGLHDKWVGSLVTRSRTSGAGATAVGCLFLIIATAAIFVIIWAILLVQILPILEEYLV